MVYKVWLCRALIWREKKIFYITHGLILSRPSRCRFGAQLTRELLVRECKVRWKNYSNLVFFHSRSFCCSLSLNFNTRVRAKWEKSTKKLFHKFKGACATWKMRRIRVTQSLQLKFSSTPCDFKFHKFPLKFNFLDFHNDTKFTKA